MDFLANKEYQTLKGEEENTESTLTANQVILEKSFNGDLGKEIRRVLSEPQAPEKKPSRWTRFKRKLTGLLANN